MGQQDVEVTLGDVRAGVADLVGTPAAGQRPLHLARRAGIDPDALRDSRPRPGRGRPRGPRGAGWPSSRTGRGTGARSRRGPPGAIGRSPRTGSGRTRTAASRARARASRRPGRRSAADRRRRCRVPVAPTTARRSRAWRKRSRRPARIRRASPTVGCAEAPRAPPGVQRSGPSSTATPMRLEQPVRGGGDLGDRRLEGRRVSRRRCPIAADLADVLAGGGLQFAGRRGLVGATQGLDASAHGRRVHRVSGVRYRPMDTVATRRRSWLIVAIAAAIATGLVVGLAIDVARSGGPGAWFARHRLPPPYAAAGRQVDIGPRSLYLDCRGSGSPTIVLEAGSGADSGTWSAVHDELATTTRTCAYDRTGRGRSDPRPRHPSPMRRPTCEPLLAAAREPGPFVLVGHSLGGAFGRVFAATYRDEVAGLVLVDAFNPDLESAWIHPLLGSLRGEYRTRLDGLRAHVVAGRFARLGRQRSPASGGLAGRTPDRGPGGSAVRATPRRGDEHGRRRQPGGRPSNRCRPAGSPTPWRGAPATTSTSTARIS